jgi:hypothetical protein
MRRAMIVLPLALRAQLDHLHPQRPPLAGRSRPDRLPPGSRRVPAQADPPRRARHPDCPAADGRRAVPADPLPDAPRAVRRARAIWLVTLPAAYRGMLAAAGVAWARSFGEFGPILVFAGATRMKTEALPTTVWLELSVGNLEAAVAVSVLMVALATLVLTGIRLAGGRA